MSTYFFIGYNIRVLYSGENLFDVKILKPGNKAS